MAEEAKLRPWVPLAVTAVSLALALDQIRLGWGARHAEAAHLLAVPPLWVWIPVAVALLACAGTALFLAPRPGRSRLARLPTIALVGVIFLQLFVLPPVRPGNPTWDSTLPSQTLAQLLREQLPPGPLPATAEELAPFLEQIPAPPLLVRGERLPRWALKVRTGCQGPDLDARGVAAGTLLYCRSADGHRAWITAVGRTSTTFGPPELLAWGGKPYHEELEAPPQP